MNSQNSIQSKDHQINPLNNIHLSAEMDEWAIMARLNDYNDKTRIQEELSQDRLIKHVYMNELME